MMWGTEAEEKVLNFLTHWQALEAGTVTFL